jgi:hypothetical protein
MSKRLLLLALGMVAVKAAMAQYKVVDLTPPLPDNQFAFTYGDPWGSTSQNNGGVQVGSAAIAIESGDVLLEPVMWQSTIDSLIHLAAPNVYGYASGTDGIQEVGFLGSPIPNAALWSGSADSFVNLNPPSFASSQALGVSNGEQVGYGMTPGTSVGSDSRFTFIQGGMHAVKWTGTASSFVDLNPVNFDASSANGVDQGVEVGGAVRSFDGVTRAIRWTGTPDSAVDISPVSDWVNNPSVAGRIRHGQTTGYFYSFGQSHAALWTGATADSAIDLHPAGYFDSVSNDTNGVNQVGVARVGNGLLFGDLRNHAMLWSGSAASAIDLHQYLPGGWKTSTATSISDDGTITVVAHRFLPGNLPLTLGLSFSAGLDITHTYLLVPTSDSPACAIASLTLDHASAPIQYQTSTSPLSFPTPVHGTITLTSPAPPGGAVVKLVNLAMLVGSQKTVTVPEGQTSETFLATDPLIIDDTSGLTEEQPIAASYGGITKEASFNTISPNPTWAGGGPIRQGFVGQILLAAPVDADEYVTLTSSDPDHVQVPPTFMLHKGMAFSTYYYTSTPDLVSKLVTISGTCSRGAFSGQVSVLAFSRPVAQVATISPTTTPSGQPFTLTVTGVIFAPGAQVMINGTPVPTHYISSTSLTADVPATATPQATQYQVIVTNPKAFGSNTVLLATTAPALGSVSPNSLAAGTQTNVTLTGTNFFPGAQLYIGSGPTVVTTTWISAKQMTATIPASVATSAGTIQAFVRNPNSITNSTTVNVTVTNPRPAISSLSPSTLPIGTPVATVTINGTGFVSTSQVSLSGKAATTTYVSPTQLQVTIPATSLSKKATISITIQNPTPGGGGSNGVNLTVS